jgi:RimJ/RimL family protein N-acetyltransferase
VRAAYRIETERLVLRCWEPGDAAAMKEAIDSSLPELLPWMPWAEDEPETVAEKLERIRGFRGRFDLDEDYTYGIFERGEGRAIGGTGLHTRAGVGAREIGYWLRSDMHRRGYMTEAVRALVRVAFEVLDVERLEIRCAPDNAASAGVARNAGFHHEATLRKRFRYPAAGGPHDELLFSLFAGDFAESPAASAECRAFDVAGERLL